MRHIDMAGLVTVVPATVTLFYLRRELVGYVRELHETGSVIKEILLKEHL